LKAKIYTKTGDKGQTGLVGGKRVSKNDPRLEAYGTVDELNSCIGLAISLLPKGKASEIASLLKKIQNELFNLGSRLACDDAEMLKQLPAIDDSQITAMEKMMDVWEGKLAPLKNFILPGGSQASAALHMARTVCRRAERRTLAVSGVEPKLIVYLNRLSDFLFTMARQVNAELGEKDIPWEK
jgi:cob(I)alamin adenosyltransferase